MNKSVYTSTIVTLSEAVSQFDLLVIPSHADAPRPVLQATVERVLRSILAPSTVKPVLLDARPVVVLRRSWEEFCSRKLRLLAPRGALVGEIHRGVDAINAYVSGVQQFGIRFEQLIGASSELRNVGFIVSELLQTRLPPEKMMGLNVETKWREAELMLWRKSARSLRAEHLHEVIATSVHTPHTKASLQIALSPDDRDRLREIMSSEAELKARMDSRFIYSLRKWWDSSEGDARFEIAALALLLHAFGESLRVPWVSVESDAELALYLAIHEPIDHAGDLRPLAWSCARLARLAAVAGSQKDLVEGAADMAARIASSQRCSSTAPAFARLVTWFAESEQAPGISAGVNIAAEDWRADWWSRYSLLDSLADGGFDWGKLVMGMMTSERIVRHGPASRVRVSDWMCPAKSRLACVLLDRMLGERWRALLLAESREDLTAFEYGLKSSADMATFCTLAAMALASMAAIITDTPSLLDGVRAQLGALTTVQRLGEYGSVAFRDDLLALENAAKAVYAPILLTSVETLADALATWSDPEQCSELATELLLLGDAPVLPGYGPAYGEPERNRDVAWSGQHLDLWCLHTVYRRHADHPRTCRLGGSFLMLSRLPYRNELDWYALRLWISFTTERHPFERLQIEKYAREHGVKMPHMERDDNLSAALNAGISDWINCTSLPSEEVLRARIDRIAQALWARRDELEAPARRTP